MSKPKSNALKILATLLMVGAGVGFLVYSSMAEAEPYQKVDGLMARPADFAGKTMHVHGNVEAGSISKKIVDQKSRMTFVLENNGKRIPVQFEGPEPDTFRDGSEVVAKGRLLSENGKYTFHARELSAKCPSKYEGAPGGNASANNKGKLLFDE